MIAAGELNRRLDIQQPKRGQETDSGEVVIDWQTVATVWGSIRPLSGRELVVAHQTQLQTSHVITIRYTTELTSDCRLVFTRYDGTLRIFNIDGIIDNEDRHIALMVYVTEVTSG